MNEYKRARKQDMVSKSKRLSNFPFNLAKRLSKFQSYLAVLALLCVHQFYFNWTTNRFYSQPEIYEPQQFDQKAEREKEQGYPDSGSKVASTLDQDNKSSSSNANGGHKGPSSLGNDKQSYSNEDTLKKAKEILKGYQKIDEQKKTIVEGKKSKSNKIVDSFSTSVKFSGATDPGSTSAVLIDEQNEFVFKSINKVFDIYDTAERELCVLGLLTKFSWAPKVMWHNRSEMITTYMGKPMTVFNIPLDYREQYEKIIADLESAAVSHGDIYKECFLIKSRKICFERNKKGRGLFHESYELMAQQLDGKTSLSLVDFGWAQVHGSWACNNQTRNKIPHIYKPREDRLVFKNLDLTFQRHVQVEQHFMVDWKLYYTEEKIREVIRLWPNLLIKKMVQHPQITDKERRVKTFSKFYNVHVDDFRGTTPFNMYFIYDMQPKYDWRPSSKGKRLVNVAMFDLKTVLRNAMGEKFSIHATDNIQETKENQIALEQPEEYQQRKFDSLSRVFDVLNFSGVDYVVLRNFEKMPDKVKVDPYHLDVDLLVSDYYEAKRLLDGDCPLGTWKTSYENGHYRVVNKVIIDDIQVNFDLRHVGDNYLDKQWQLDILRRRVKFGVGIYIPSEEDHLYSIIYHAIVQKSKISDTYVKVMTSLGNFTDAQARDKKFLRDRLARFMEKAGYRMVKPHDKSVVFITK